MGFYSHLAASHAIRCGNPRTRWEIEARLLAGQADAAIAARLGVEGGVVAAYEAVFFSVRDRLGCPDWISLVVIGGIGIGGVELLWKRLAYAGGPGVLDALIDHHDAGLATSESIAGPPLARPERLALIEASIEVTSKSAPKILLLDALAREIEARDAADRVAAVSGPVVAMGVEAQVAANNGTDEHGRCAGHERGTGNLTSCTPTILPSFGQDEDGWFRATG